MNFHSTRRRPRSASGPPCPTLPPSSQRQRIPRQRRRICSWTPPIGMEPPSFGSCWACNFRDRLDMKNNSFKMDPTKMVAAASIQNECYEPRFDPTALFDFSPDAAAVDLAPSALPTDPEEDGSKAGYSYTSVRLGLKLMLIWNKERARVEWIYPGTRFFTLTRVCLP